jgi:hypothetical protein
MEKILFEDATLTSQAKVTIDGVDHLVTEAEYSGGTDLNANTFNQLQDNVENSIDEAKNTVNKVDNKFNYSTEKQVIGTWIDGKPIYRKVYQFKITSLPHRINIENVDTPIKMYGVISYNVGWHNIGGNTDSNYYSLLQYDVQDKRLSLFGSDSYIGSNYDTYVVFEYTKTTD